MHIVFTALAFASLIAACLVVARHFRDDPAWEGWRVYSQATGILVAVLFIEMVDLASSSDPNAPVRLVQRLCIITGGVGFHCWHCACFANGLLWKNVDGEPIKMTLFGRSAVT